MYLSIQYLRGISAFAVVYFHLYQTTGQQGVAIFFVISGFIMIDIMNKKHRTPLEFFKARFLRVAPLYYLLTILTLALGLGYDPTFQRLLQSLTFTALGSVLPVGFTLTYEFIFYTLVSISILFFKKMIYKLIFLSLSLSIGDSILNYILVSKNYEYGNYFWFFIFGMIVYELYNQKEKISKHYTIDFLLILLFTISIIFLFLGRYLGFDYYYNDVNHYMVNNLIPSFLIVLCGLMLESRNKIFNSKFLLLLGNASYSIYLTHYIVIHGIHDYYDKNFNTFILLISCIIIGILNYKYLEIPIMNYIKGKYNNATAE
ncbi:MAG: acyltransferase [Arcobacteraceae bacterium]|nr:acyltransferase [Arcobacteraceae bacterium]